MAKPLAKRIDNALTNPRARIAELEELLPVIATERERLLGEHASAAADSINFRLDDLDRDAAALRADKARRDAAALDAALVELGGAIDVKRNSERQKAKEAERAAAIAERDALARQIAEQWPAACNTIVALIEAIEANDARLTQAGIHEPSAEAVARKCSANFQMPNQGGPVKRFTRIQLPSMDPRTPAWPAQVKPIDYSAMYRQSRQEATERAVLDADKWKRYRISDFRGHGVPFVARGADGRDGHRKVISNGSTDEWLTAAEVSRLRAINVTVEEIADELESAA